VGLDRVAGTRNASFLFAAIVALAGIGAMLPDGQALRLAVLAPVSYAIAILGDAATAIILLSTWRLAPSRATLVLGLSFAASAAVLFLASLVLPLLPRDPPIISAHAQSGLWLYVFWHLIAAAGAFTYIAFRQDEHIKLATRRFTIAAIAITVAVTVGSASTAFVFASRMPILVEGVVLTRLVTSGVGPAAVAALALAAFLAFRMRRPSLVDRALAFSLLSLTLEMTMLLAGGHRYSVSYYVGRILLLLGALFVLVSAIRTLVSSRVQLHLAERALEQLTDEAAKRAGRIRALWEIASQVGRPIEYEFDELLKTATAAIRPGKMMFGTLSHLVDETIVIDAISWSAPESQGMRFMDTIFPGATFDLRGTLAESLLAEPGTCAWDDLSVLDGHGAVWEKLGWQSYIGRKLTAGRDIYLIGFASLQTMIDQPFAEDDAAYVDVVASFVETRFSEALHYERLQFQIEHDALTGLHNRAQFRNAIRQELARDSEFAIAFVNIDEFRFINERQGHMLGDEVLVEVAVTLAGVNSNDLVARMNGDEFGILLRDTSALKAVSRVLDSYAEVFREPFHTGDRDGTRLIKLSASIGAARFPEDGTSPEELMRRADLALSLAKTQGGATTSVFNRSMEEMLEASHVRFAELADAIAGDQLDLAYQPTFDLATRQIVGAEALVRWNHPERGYLLPAEFVPFAERNGLIGTLTRWVFRRIIRDFSGGVALPKGFRVYFNVAAQTLDEFTFISELNDALKAAPDLAEHLGIEMTETAAMQNIESAMHTINLLRKWGLAVAIDDFGTGYSSLSYLKQLTVDVIKIDRSFVTGLPHDERDGVITEMLLRISDQFKLSSLAEGIETEAQAAWLLHHGCRFGQGYLISRPDSLEALLERLRQRKVVI
jgi:diguanylate cyclase (GGDEF)-like protein